MPSTQTNALRALSICLLGLAVSAAQGQTASAAPPSASASARPDQLTVIEDDGVRIEELRRQGQVVRVHVQSKVANSRGYDVVIKPSAESASQQRGNAGRSAWNLLSF